jgi:hypothetical protein
LLTTIICAADNDDDESTQYDTQGEEEDSADDSDAAVGEERLSRDLPRHLRCDDEFLDLDAEETAKQLTLIDNQLFRYTRVRSGNVHFRVLIALRCTERSRGKSF